MGTGPRASLEPWPVGLLTALEFGGRQLAIWSLSAEEPTGGLGGGALRKQGTIWSLLGAPFYFENTLSL